ncbi:hypothetical protein E0W80_10430 [Microbacterium sp. PI-1]|uniref:hypothetical protein n=1 Tax=Microbacterium sp. PI-1 TaxID=2545631 RepID=UPI00103AD762|nr:hypothetical protein [Microbacterium sp. PI-1]TCJ23549.1 hypothetical protein E0W80_10430 [Microbacterium sp. PI-1]
MSLLMFICLDDAVQVITDTLVSDGETREPVMYHHKVRAFPQLDMLAVVTGFANFGDHWFTRLGQIPGLRDIEDVNRVAGAELPEIYQQWQDYYAPKDIGTSTVYLFGFTAESEKIVRYVYRSPKGFDSERSEGICDFAVKPPPQQFELVAPEDDQAIIDLAVKLRDENDNGRTDGPVAIGGDLYRTFMMRGQTVTERMHRWPDHSDMLEQMKHINYV